MNIFTKARDLGVQAEFIDGQGRPRVTAEAALQTILEALPERTPYRFVTGPAVVRAGHASPTALNQAARLPLRWKIVDGPALIAHGEVQDHLIAWPEALPVGAFRLELTDAAGEREDVPLIASPEHTFSGELERGWLLAVQLYGVRSVRNWGIGDFTDLEALIELAADLGADGIGLNPLHVLFDDKPADCSPYSPNSRLFLNALYIDVDRIPEFSSQACPEAADATPRLRQSPVVDYVEVAQLKWRALRSAFDRFTVGAAAARRKAFAEYQRTRAPLLSHFACFEVLRHRFKRPWWEWPEQWRRPDDRKCAELRAGPDGPEIEFIEFVQWTAETQLQAASACARRLGMRVGLYLDVAVGVQSDGFDAWNEQAAISRQLAVGAPPDALNTVGQDWGLAGFNPAGLEARSFEPFRDMLRASMRHAGAIRLDHVLGLKRLYLVPRGFRPDNGAYVRMPFEALLAVIALESEDARCIVIGEDLGTVPEGFREQMADWGVWSYLVMMFERDERGAFRGADHYRANALVTLNTHDLATYTGWRSFGDLKTKRALGIDPGESDDARWHALAMLDDVLRHHGIQRHDLYSVLGFLARTRSRLLAVSLEDLLGVADQPNIPGTIDEHPNWRQRMPLAVDEIAPAIDTAALRKAMQGRSGAV
jgi:4-alpha-glucanotransferase